MREALKYLVGSLTVYGVVAACNSRAERLELESLVDAAPAPDPAPEEPRRLTDAGRTQPPDASPTQCRPVDAGSVLEMVADSAVPVAMAQIESGDRLRAAWWTTPRGLKYPRGLWDAQLELDCSPLPASAERWRCFPRSGVVYYRDRSCSEILLGAPPIPGDDGLPKYITVARHDSFYDAYRVVRPHEANVYDVDVDGACRVVEVDVPVYVGVLATLDLAEISITRD